MTNPSFTTQRETVSEPEAANDSAVSESALIEIGWIVAGQLDDADWQATQQAMQGVMSCLQSTFPQFRWRMPLIRRDELTAGPREEPSVLLGHGVSERNAKHWDFTIIVTGVELASHYQDDAVAVVSRSLESMVISTCRLDPRSTDPGASEDERIAKMTRRMQRLVLHGIGHHGGLGHINDADNYMFPIDGPEDADQPGHFSSEQQQQLVEEFEEIADRRLEEEETFKRANPLRFYLASSWINRREIVSAIREAKPWQFPFRLSRLTTAAISAMLILIVTAEVWEVATGQAGWAVTVLSLVAVFSATAYVILRQGLYIRRHGARLTEQTVTTNVTTAIVVLLGMTTTYLLAFGIALLAGLLFFSPRLVQGWTGENQPGISEYLTLAGFIASLALFIGALGASFESNHYIRHITFVDEEI